MQRPLGPVLVEPVVAVVKIHHNGQAVGKYLVGKLVEGH